jgi:hypothetical protein
MVTVGGSKAAARRLESPDEEWVPRAGVDASGAISATTTTDNETMRLRMAYYLLASRKPTYEETRGTTLGGSFFPKGASDSSTL